MRTDQINLNIEYARFDYHKDQVWEIKFVQRGGNLLMASTSYDGRIVVTSIDELQVIFNLDLNMMPRNMIFHPHADYLYLINNEWQVHKISFDIFELPLPPVSPAYACAGLKAFTAASGLILSRAEMLLPAVAMARLRCRHYFIAGTLLPSRTYL